MRRLLKFLHTMGAIGLIGAMTCLLVLAMFAPPATSLAGYALIYAAMAKIATWTAVFGGSRLAGESVTSGSPRSATAATGAREEIQTFSKEIQTFSKENPSFLQGNPNPAKRILGHFGPFQRVKRGSGLFQKFRSRLRRVYDGPHRRRSSATRPALALALHR